MDDAAASGPAHGGPRRPEAEAESAAGGGAPADVAGRVQLVYPESLADSVFGLVLHILFEGHGRCLGDGAEGRSASDGPAAGPAEPAPAAPCTVETGPGSAPVAGPELPFALGDHLAGLVPGPALAAELVTLDAAALDLDATVEAVAAWDRLMSWAAARQAELVRSLVEHEGRFGRREFAADAVATRLRVTRQAARSTMERAELLGAWPEVSDLLTSGRIDAHKAGAIVTAIADTPAELRQTVLDTVLPGAPDVTAPTVRNRIRSAAQAMDPGLAQVRAASEAERRSVRLTPAPDAMAYLTFYLPADQASTCLTAIDAIAAAARTPEDERSADARRVDAVTDLLRAVLDAGRTPSGVELPIQQHRRPHIQVTVAATTLLGLDGQPAELAGYGPIPAEMARRIAADGTWRRLVLDPATGRVIDRDSTTYRPGADLTAIVVSRDPTCTFPGCRVPSWRCDLDHLVPFRRGQDAADQTTAENLHPLCRHHHRLKTHTDWTVRRDPRTGRTTWTTPWGRHYVDQPEPLPGVPAPAGCSSPGSTPPSATTGSRPVPPDEARPPGRAAPPPDPGPPPY